MRVNRNSFSRRSETRIEIYCHIRSCLIVPSDNILHTSAAAYALPKQLNNGRVVSPEDAVAIHTETFERLADMYSVKKPTSKADMMKDTGNILASLFCDEGDSDCISNVNNATAEHFHSAEDEPRTINEHPGNSDSNLVASLDKMTSAVHRTDDNTGYDMNDVVNELTSIKEEIEDMDDITTEYKLAALSGISMASESAVLWQKIYSDPNHPLYGLHHPSYFLQDNNDNSTAHTNGDINDNNRKLQNADTAGIILAVVLAVVGAISEGDTDPFSLIMAVVSAALSGGVGGEDDDYDYDGGDYDYGGNIFQISQVACAFGVPVPLLC